MKYIVICYFLFTTLVVSLHSQRPSTNTETHTSEYLLLQDPLLFVHEDVQNIGTIEYQRKKRLQQARIYIDDQNFLEALEIYSYIYSNNKEDMIALLGIANVYFFIGDYTNAKQYYLDLYTKIDQLPYDEKNILRYRLATIYFLEENPVFFEAMLQEIIDQSNKLQKREYTILQKILLEDGLDQVHVYVNLPFDSSFYAFRELGIYYINTQRSEEGIALLLGALSMLQEHINDYLTSIYPTYRYTDLRRMIELVYDYHESLREFKMMGVDRILFSIYSYINTLNVNTVAYEKRYVSALLEMFHRNFELLSKTFSYVPFLL